MNKPVKNFIYDIFEKYFFSHCFADFLVFTRLLHGFSIEKHLLGRENQLLEIKSCKKN
jgi:hypothetical protein